MLQALKSLLSSVGGAGAEGVAGYDPISVVGAFEIGDDVVTVGRGGKLERANEQQHEQVPYFEKIHVVWSRR